MADERKAYAGDLGSDAIGKTVVVPKHGLDGERQGVVSSVSHDTGATGKPVTSVTFVPAGPLESAPLVVVDSTVIVEVRP